MSAWELQNGFTENLGNGVFIRWSQLQRVYYAVKRHQLICKGTNLIAVRKDARFYA